MGFRLRNYQCRCLDALGDYLLAARREGAKRAFVLQTERPYRSVPQLPELPYVCLRVPTGGGKTIMAAHAVGLAAARFLERDGVVCLWLVPSNAILDQTVARLSQEGDPYRDALISHFGGRATVLRLAEALQVQRGTLDGETVVLVSTLAALRVEDTEGRKVYEQNGALQHHFPGMDQQLFQGLERREDGKPVESLANVLRLRRPVIIMDEAHTARTPLSFDTLARFAPSCVLEFTATPETRHAPEAGHFASNVLAHVSAAELKAEEMIKLPLRLWTRSAWTDAVADSLAKQRELEAEAAKERALGGEPLRPIVLLQAEAQRQGGTPITVEVLEQCLLRDHHIPAEQIAVATGSRRELDGVDLSVVSCPIRYVITVQALREGWDCPQAYVLCSVANQASPRAVEQVLGRVLRMPGAKRKAHELLNRSYAYVVSASFADAANGLRDALIENGFERFEANTLIESGAALPGLFAATAEVPVSVVLPEAPDLEVLDATIRPRLRFEDTTMVLTASAPIAAAVAARLADTMLSPEGKSAIFAFARRTRDGSRPESAAAPEQTFLRVPRLAVRRGGVLELFEDSHFLDTPWRLSERDPVLTDTEFPLVVSSGTVGELDVSRGGQIQVSFQDQVSRQLALLDGEPGWTLPKLAIWLDRNIPHPDLTQGDVSLFLQRSLEELMARAGISLAQLARDKHRLRTAFAGRIDRFRREMRGTAYQASLFQDVGGEVEVSDELGLLLGDPDQYAPNWFYEGPFQFRKHLFLQIGELKVEGEETDCAMQIEVHPNVDRWVRNLERRPAASFWLQTSTDKFYPDFVGRLVDGRVFAIEYKGAHLWTAADAMEKRAVGALWAERSDRRCVFFMPHGPDWAGLNAALA